MQRRILALAVLASIATPAIPQSAADKQARLEDIRARIADVQERIASDREARDDVTAALAEIEREIGEIGQRLHDLDARIAETQTRIDELSAKAGRQREALSGRLDRLGERIRAAYKVGRQGRLQLLLSQDDPAQIGRLLAYYEYYAEAQADAVARTRTELAALVDTRREMTAQQKRLEADRAERAGVLDSLEASRRQREQTLAKIEDRLSERDRRVETLKADAEELETLIASLQESLKDVSPEPADTAFAELEGHLPAPVNGRRIAGFGDDKAGGRLSWQGVWLAAESGTPVTAAATGRVVHVGWMHRYGLIVVLDHGGDYYTLYGHNQSVFVEAGDRVRAGDEIGTAGSSGGHDRSGVYFEIRRGRTPVDPAAWLAS